MDEELNLVRAAIAEKPWFMQSKALRAYLRDALDRKGGSPPAESTLTAILDRAAVHILENPRARGKDLESLASLLAQIWQSQEVIASRLKALRR